MFNIFFSRLCEKRAEKQKSLEIQGFSRLYLFYSPFLVAEVGFFIALQSRISASVGYRGYSHHDRLQVIASRRSPSCVVLCAMHSLASKLALWATPFAKTPHRGVFAALTQRATLVGITRRAERASHTPKAKKKTTRNGWFLFWLRRWDLNLTTSGL